MERRITTLDEQTQMIDFLLFFYKIYPSSPPKIQKRSWCYSVRVCKIAWNWCEKCPIYATQINKCNTRKRIIVFPLLFLVLWLSSQASKQNATMLQEMACLKNFAWLVPRLGISQIHLNGHVPRAGLSFDHSRACPNILYNADVAQLLYK